MNTTSKHLQVVCAWPVSGQYGPGSRVLYYALIATCVFARKAVWLRNACLAAALLFPAVAAVHGIVLAAVHNDSAVDMDVYGAFQLCSIGILAAPVTVRLSRTYFFDPSRNTIFLWTGLILAGLLSLTVEFFRIGTSSCTHDDSNKPISPKASRFHYNNTTCGLTCSVDKGPYSPLRGGSTNNIYVIPAPDKLTFETATLLAAGCCIPAILSLISMWDKILKINWKTRWGNRDEDNQLNQLIDGTNGATVEKMRGVNNWVRLFLSAVEIPVFSGAVLTILIIGERNFFSPQVNYQTEPIASIGQWAPIVGTSLAALGSLYHLLAVDIDAVKKESMQEAGTGLSTVSSHSLATPSAVDMRRSISNESGGATSERMPPTQPPATVRDVGNRRKVAKALTEIHNYLGTAAHDRFDDSAFKRGKALDFPEIPGEEHRNVALSRIREQYNPNRDAEGNVTPDHRSRVSFTGSIASGYGAEASTTTPEAVSPQSPYSPSPLPQLPTAPEGQHASSLPTQGTSFEPQSFPLSSPAASSGARLQQMGDTLQVPSPVHHSPARNNISASSDTSIGMIPEGPSDANTSSPAQTSPSESLHVLKLPVV